jgi:hypothetical protein
MFSILFQVPTCPSCYTPKLFQVRSNSGQFHGGSKWNFSRFAVNRPEVLDNKIHAKFSARDVAEIVVAKKDVYAEGECRRRNILVEAVDAVNDMLDLVLVGPFVDRFR